MLNSYIYAWLAGTQNFTVGRALYKQLGKDDTVKAELLTGNTAKNRALLKTSMESLLTPKFDGAINEVWTVQTDSLIDSPASPPVDPILDALQAAWKPLYSRMNYLRAALDQYGERNDPEAVAALEPMAFEILALEDQCNAIWQRRDHYVKHGRLPDMPPEDEEPLPTDPIALGKLLEAVKRNIRRNKVKMSAPGADAVYAQLYLQYKEKYKLITGKPYEEKL